MPTRAIAGIISPPTPSVARSSITAFVESEDETDCRRDAWKASKTYRYPKGGRKREAVPYSSTWSSALCSAVRTLSTQGHDGLRSRRGPAMAAGLTDHFWTIAN